MHHANVACLSHQVPEDTGQFTNDTTIERNLPLASKEVQILLCLLIFLMEGGEYLSSLPSASQLLLGRQNRTKQKDSLALELVTSTPRSLSLRFKRVLILTNCEVERFIRGWGNCFVKVAHYHNCKYDQTVFSCYPMGLKTKSLHPFFTISRVSFSHTQFYPTVKIPSLSPRPSRCGASDNAMSKLSKVLRDK